MHEIHFFEFNAKKPLTEIKKEISEWLGENTLAKSIKFDTVKVCEDSDSAHKYLDELADSSFYGQFAVRYESRHLDVKDLPKQWQELRIKKNDLMTKHDYVYLDSIKNMKSKFISCPQCESKFNREMLISKCITTCPLCSTVLAGKVAMKKKEEYNNQIQNQAKKMDEIYKKTLMKQKPEIFWLVRVEYHV